MKSNSSWRVRLAQILLGAVIVIALFVTRGVRAGDEPVHLVTDWSHRHLIFSAPKNLADQIRLSGNARYHQQLLRRNAERNSDPEAWRWRRAPEKPDLLKGDWNAYLGSNGATAGTAGVDTFPAKFSFDPTSANCATPAPPAGQQPDFVVYNTSLTGSTTAVAAHDTATFSAEAVTNSTVTITNNSTGDSLVLTAGATNSHTTTSGSTSTGVFENADGGANANGSATGLAASIDVANNGSFVGVSATSSGAVVTITATIAGTGGNSITITESTSPASNLTSTFANLVDGASGIPTIVAYDNLYSSCNSGAAPTTYWAYVTGTAGGVTTSPVLSGDGTQVAFVQGTAGAAELVLFKWKADGSTVDNPTNLTGADTVTNANYRSCTAPCMTTITFNDATTGTPSDMTDTLSSPFYNYEVTPVLADTLYVGDDDGYLHEFTGVFHGNPAENCNTANGTPTCGVNNANFPAHMASTPISSPVYDEGSGEIFTFSTYCNGTTIVAPCKAANGFGGKIHYCPVASCTVANTIASDNLGPQATQANCGGSPGVNSADNLIMDAPIIDPTNGTIYVVVGQDGSASSGHSALYQFSEGFTGNTCGNEVTLGTGSANGSSVYDGQFNNKYYDNTGETSPFMYVCGNAGGSPTLFQITVSSAGIMTAGAGTAGPVLTNTTTPCSPVAEFYNSSGTAADYLFMSMQATGTTAPTNCTASSTGCIVSFNLLASGFTFATATPTASTNAAGGTSGIVVDNSVSGGGASQVYFTPLSKTVQNCTTTGQQGIGGCAIQASQSILGE